MALRFVPIDVGKTIKLDKPVLLCGRNPDCDVVLIESQKVSRMHCIVACIDNRVFVRDLGSTNGLWVNGQRVERESRVRIGDELAVADIKFELVNGDDEPPVRDERRVKKPTGRERADQPEPELELDIELNDPPQRAEEVPRRRIVNRVAPGQNEPVAIPDEDNSFVVEPSIMRMQPVRLDEGDLLPLARLLEEDDEPPPAPSSRKPKRSAKDVVIPLEEDDLPLPNRGDSDHEIRLDLSDD